MKRKIITLVALTTLGHLNTALQAKTINIKDLEINRYVNVGSHYDICFYACKKGADTTECKEYRKNYTKANQPAV